MKSIQKIFLTIGMIASWVGLSAQGTIDTYAIYPDNNGSSAVSFEVESTTPIEITDIANVYNATTTSSDVWVRVGGIGTSTSPLSVTTANGWVQHQTGATVAGNGSTPVSIQSLTPIVIPANTPVGIVITGGMRYSGTGAAPPSPTSFTDGPVTLRTGGTWGYGGVVPSLGNSPRAFLGTMTYSLGVVGNCTPFTNFLVDSISGDAAKVSWVSGTGNSSYFIEYGVSGFTAGTGTSLTGGSSPVVLSSLSDQTTYDLYFGEICNSGADSVYFPTPQQFTTTKACTQPQSFTNTGVTETTADFTWTTIGTAASSFTIIYGPEGFDPTTSGSTQSFTASPATVNTLSPGTAYDAYIYSDCGGSGLSDTTNAIMFTTVCGVLTAPYIESFDGSVWVASGGNANNEIDDCWTSGPDVLQGTEPFKWIPRSTGPTSGNGPLQDVSGAGNYMYVEASSTTAGDTAALTSPPIDVSGLTTPALYFHQHRFSNGNIADMEIWVSNDSMASWDTVYNVSGDIQTANSDPWVSEFVNLGLYTGDTIFLRFIQRGFGCCGDAAIDSVVVDEAPLCPWPTAVNFTRSTSTTAHFDWNDPLASQWEYEWGPVGFLQGTGTFGTFMTDPDTVTGLSPNRSYDLYIRTDCSGSGNGTSVWIGPITFYTQCASFTAPYSNNFDADLVGSKPGCWESFISVAGATDGTVQTISTNTPYSSPNHVDIDNGSGTTASNDSVILISPRFSDLTASDKRVNFFSKTSTAGTQVIVGTMSEYYDAGSFSPIDTITLATTFNYYQVNLDAANGYNGTDEYVAFYHNNNATNRSIYIDDFLYESIPPCIGSLITTLAVDSLGSDVANVSWSGGQGDSTDIEWGIPGFIPGTGASIGSALLDGNDSTFSITSLNGSTTYEFYIRDTCNASGAGNWVGPISFTTRCSITPITLPFNEDFESYTGPISIDGEFYCGTSFTWAVERPGNTGDILFNYTASGGPTPPFNGLQSAGFQSLSSNDPIYLILTVDLSNSVGTSGGVNLSFNYADHADEVNPGDRVWARGSAGDPWVEIFDWSTVNSNNWEFADLQLRALLNAAGQSLSGSTQIRWGQQDNAALTGNDGFAIDDVEIYTVSCPDPTGLTATGITSSSAYLNWDPANSVSGYEAWYGPVGFYQGTQTTGGTKGTSNVDSLLVNTLGANTCYEYVLRNICGPGDTSDWVGPFVFCTLCSSQLSGTYTIDAAQATAGTNFNSFTDAAKELNDCGISGPVTFNVAAGTYTEYLYLEEIIGASNTNTITFDGSSAAAAILTFSSTTDTPTVYLNGADWIIVSNMTVENTSPSDAWGIMFQNGADNNTIEDCIITIPVGTTTDRIGIVASNSLTFETSTGNNANNATIRNNRITGGESGIHLTGGANNAASNTGHMVLNNVIRYTDDHGIEVDGQANIIISGNDIDSVVSAFGDALFLQDINDFEVTGNRALSSDWAFYLNDGNDGASVTSRSLIANNMFASSTDYGMYVQDYEETDIFHNSAEGTTGIRINDQINTDIRNNIFVSTTGFAFESDDALGASDSINYNLYYASNATDAFDVGTSTYLDLAAWQAGDVVRNISSVEGDPVFLSSGEDLHTIGSLANNIADNSTGITEDFDGDVRSTTTPDIGADEFTPISGDLALIKGEFRRDDPCLTTSDTIALYVQNIIGPAVDFSVNSLDINYDVTGPINTSGTFTQNSGTLNPTDTLIVIIDNIDMSAPGTYQLDANISVNPDNTLQINDTLISITIEVDSILTVSPKSATIINSTDSVQITANSPFFPGGAWMITEICHFKTGTGAPAAGWPAYLTADDYIEVTGVPGADLDGYTLEQWSGTAMTGSMTFGPGTVASPNGALIIMIGAGATADDPSNFIYDGRGGSTTTYASSTAAGRIIKDPSGNIVDAVAYGATYAFPAAANVTPADWSGNVPASTSTSGIRLEGPDLNDGADWIASATSPQDPSFVNNNVPVPTGVTIAGFQWTLNGTQVTTDPQFHAGPYTVSGVYEYVAELTKCGTTFRDTVTVNVIIPTCATPLSLSSTAISSSSAQVSFDTTGYGSGAAFLVEYGTSGFALGTGTELALTNVNSTVINNLTQNLCMDVYYRVECTPGDTSFAIGPISMCPEAVPCDDMDNYAAGSNFDQSALFIPWQNGGAAAWGDAEFTSTQAQSSPNSLHVNDIGTAGVSDLVAYFDTIDSGLWEVVFDMYVENNAGAYFNIQQNHDTSGANNQWNAEIYFQSSGIAQVQHSAGGTVIGNFNYNSGQWDEMKVVIDLDNDSIWFEYAGVATGIGYDYSDANTGQPLQFNGVNFFSGPLAPQTYPIDFYVDNFCVSALTSCADPTNLATNIIRCDSVELSWTSGAGIVSSDIEWGAAGFAVGTGAGTAINGATNPQMITGLSPNTSYDFYVRDICTTDSSAWVGPMNFNTGNIGAPVAAIATPVLGTPGATSQTVSFDGSSSTGIGNSYLWRFGDNTTGNGATTTHDYTANQSWTVTLVVSNACGSDSITETFSTQGISVEESLLSRSLVVFPNPSDEVVNIEFTNTGSSNAKIRLLDLTGKEVMLIEETALQGENKLSLNIGSLAKGTYILQIESDGYTANRRLVKS